MYMCIYIYIYVCVCIYIWLSGGASGKEPACQRRRNRDTGLIRKIPWRRGWKPNTVFFLENSTNRRAWQAIESQRVRTEMTLYVSMQA